MNRRSKCRAQNWWNILELNGLTLALTPGRTSAWHHSPVERENMFPRLDDTHALDLPRFRGSMRESRTSASLCSQRLLESYRLPLVPQTRTVSRCTLENRGRSCLVDSRSHWGHNGYMSAIAKSRIDPELKRQAEAVLEEIGLKPRAALELFYKQIIKRRAIPFPVQADSPEDEVLSPAARRNELADQF